MSCAPNFSESADSQQVLAAARILREQRAVTAQQLLRGLQVVDDQKALEFMHSMSWHLLDEIPVWCSLDNQSIDKVKQLCAALYLTPALEHCIDGACLSTWREMLGGDVFDQVMNCRLEGSGSAPPMLPEADKDILSTIGGAVMHVSLQKHPVSFLHDYDVSILENTVTVVFAEELCVQAYRIYQRSVQLHTTLDAQSDVLPGDINDDMQRGDTRKEAQP